MDMEALEKYDEKVKEKQRKKIKKKKIIIISITIILLIAIVLTCLYFALFKQTPKKNLKTKKQNIQEEIKKLTIVDEDSNNRPIAIMIDNNVGNNSHAGLQESYLNYEIIVEGGLTRIMAIFKDKDVSLIGPVRSSRHYFLDYALESDSIYTHYGWSTYAQNDIKALSVNNINGLYDSAPFWRDKTISAPHNVFTSIEKIYNYAETKKYEKISNNWKLLNYTTDIVDLAKPIETKTVTNEETGKKEKVEIKNSELITANTVTIPYSNHQVRSYTYDAARQVYLRFMNASAHIDKTTGQQLHYKNIIIKKVSNTSLDSYGRQDLNTTGTGDGYYITNGYALPIKWTKTARSGKTIYTYSDGSKVKINDGNTFIQIEPSNYTPTFQ